MPLKQESFALRCRVHSGVIGAAIERTEGLPVGVHSRAPDSFAASPAFCASIPTAMAICAATRRMSVKAGSRGAEGSSRAGELLGERSGRRQHHPVGDARAPDATTPSPTAGKMKTLLHWAIGIVRPA